MVSRFDRWDLVFLILAFVLVVTFSLSVAAETLMVGKTGTQFSSLQVAIDAAGPGDTLQVEEGTYKENLSIDKDLTLEGVGASKVKIDGQKEAYPVLRIGPSEVEVTVKDLTLQGAEGVSCTEYEKGPFCPTGIAAVGKTRIRVRRVTISGNGYAGIGLGDSARATVENSEIKGNEYDGIELWYSAQVTVENSEITGNGDNGNRDNGIELWYSAQATVENSEITGNGDDGIWLEGSAQATVENSEITGNGDDGIWLEESAQATVENSEITGNGDDGIWLEESAQATIQNNSIQNNGVGVEINYPENFKGNLEGSGNKIKDNGTNFEGVSESTREELVSEQEEQVSAPETPFVKPIRVDRVATSKKNTYLRVKLEAPQPIVPPTASGTFNTYDLELHFKAQNGNAIAGFWPIQKNEDDMTDWGMEVTLLASTTVIDTFVFHGVPVTNLLKEVGTYYLEKVDDPLQDAPDHIKLDSALSPGMRQKFIFHILSSDKQEEWQFQVSGSLDYQYSQTGGKTEGAPCTPDETCTDQYNYKIKCSNNSCSLENQLLS